MREIHTTLNGDFIYTGYTGTTYVVSSMSRKFDLVRPDVVHSPKDAFGWRKPTAYSTTKDSFVGPYGTWHTGAYSNAAVWHRRDGNLRSFFGGNVQPTASLPTARLRSKAEVGALLKLKDQKVNLAQAFAERKQTARLFTSNITRLVQSVRRLKRGDFRGAATELGILSNPGKPRGRDVPARWLELQYGWRPLLSDIHGACEKLNERKLENFVVTVEDIAKEETEELVKSPDWALAYAPFDIQVKSLVGVHVRLDYIPDNVVLSEFASLGLTNPALIAWELLPWSFVVDWAIPIGDWISALDAASGYSFKGGTMTQFGRKQLRYRDGVDKGHPAYSSRTTGVYGGTQSLRAGRTVYQWSPIPTLPRLKNPWSVGHVANATALLAQAMGR